MDEHKRLVRRKAFLDPQDEMAKIRAKKYVNRVEDWPGQVEGAACGFQVKNWQSSSPQEKRWDGRWGLFFKDKIIVGFVNREWAKKTARDFSRIGIDWHSTRFEDAKSENPYLFANILESNQEKDQEQDIQSRQRAPKVADHVADCIWYACVATDILRQSFHDLKTFDKAIEDVSKIINHRSQ